MGAQGADKSDGACDGNVHGVASARLGCADVEVQSMPASEDSAKSAQSGFEFNKNPENQCDLVMKGGITSGVVYPPAVLELQQKFRFRSIGGTSAGAIAAAVTAAAEFAREGGGFERLDTLRGQLAQPGFLLSLFKPSDEGQGAFRALTRLFIEAKPVAPTTSTWRRVIVYVRRAASALASSFPRETWAGRLLGSLLGVLPVLLIFVGFVAGSPRTSFSHSGLLLPVVACGVVVTVVGAWLLGLGSGVLAISRVFTRLLPEAGFFGLCVGHISEDDKSALTSWLTDQIDLLSGRGTAPSNDPLTFADLAAKKAKDGSPIDITLRMVTSNLSHGQPYVFPREGNIFLFKKDDMARFFPRRVVRYLERAGTDGGLPLPEGYLFLPEGNKLPVIVATRLSLSFPILLSAVRLYTIKPAAFSEYRKSKKAGERFVFEPGRHFQENWFSDGGIASNFPIHFFDSWLPSRPTFGINLTDVQPGAKTQDGRIKRDEFTRLAEAEDAADLSNQDEEGVTDIEDVFLPHPREGARGAPQWTGIQSMPAFLIAAFDTARNYRDSMQTLLPSYRERVVQVRLAPNEGGLNLAMDSKTIERIGNKGRLAGRKLANMDFRQHQWVRLRVLMAHLEVGFQRMREAFPERPEYEALFDQQLMARRAGQPHQKWYKPEDADWCQKALRKIEGIIALGKFWEEAFFSRDPPRPEAALRVTPPL
jgi:Patatin-like phospholipase